MSYVTAPCYAAAISQVLLVRCWRGERRFVAVRYIFLDESGDLAFSERGTRFFSLTSICLGDCTCGDELLELRRALAWEGTHLLEEFHATHDYQHVRDRVFASICQHDCRIDTTVVEKRKTANHLRVSEGRFYKQILFLHLKHVLNSVAERDDEMLVVCAALGTRREREVHLRNLRDVIAQTQPPNCLIRYAFWPAAIEPCLQVADYCSWAIHRKWERGDERSYNLIKDKIATEFDVFARGTRFFY